MNQTIAQQIKWDFETNGNLEIKDTNGNLIYFGGLDEFWTKREYDSQGNQIYFENSYGFWTKHKYDSKGKQIYFEN